MRNAANRQLLSSPQPWGAPGALGSTGESQASREKRHRYGYQWHLRLATDKGRNTIEPSRSEKPLTSWLGSVGRNALPQAEESEEPDGLEKTLNVAEKDAIQIRKKFGCCEFPRQRPNDGPCPIACCSCENESVANRLLCGSGPVLTVRPCTGSGVRDTLYMDAKQELAITV